MKINFKLIIAALSLSLITKSQNTVLEDPTINKRGCGTVAPSAEWDAWFNKKVEEFKDNKRNNKTESISIVIPVIVHVIHPGSTIGLFPNISSAQIYSQINVLNKDFAGIGFNSGQLANTGFSVVGAANTNITFCLAQLDPNGIPLSEPGIDRVNYNTMGWPSPTGPTSTSAFQSYMDGTVKPNSIWDPTYYFNIWVSDVNQNTQLLGFATFPGGSTLSGITSNIGNSVTDGIWVSAKAFGNTGSVVAPYNRGRTAVHETGHWLGLRHIGGDGNGNLNGDCLATDYCDDTPPQKGGYSGGQYGQNFGTPPYPVHAFSCSSQIGDMFMNFMDYTDDATSYMFTPDQSDRMQTALLNGYFRFLLSTSSFSLCDGMPLADINYEAIVCINSGYQPQNVTSGTPAPTYSWSVLPSNGVTFSPSSTNANPNINFPNTGDYTLSMVATNSLGVSSQTVAFQVEDCTGLRKNSIANKINLSPNPSTGIFNLNIDFTVSKEVSVTVFNSLGQLVFAKDYTVAGSNTITLDLNNYSDGIYTLSITGGEERILKKLILSK
ncbi:T9SS type A sorting domain-containing protein [Aurantibacillus circumpalustris]|uniref:T9SS type A sorting domain-containing protein n=1 Tax=Aurantibacillus circumpalustris TaxID=3036359 RepID=UPI00295B20E3|nr:T9SS type A sorting domain-containing protein [Aurantibacillus circumpalustris]